MIRFIIIILFILIFFIVSIILLPITWLIGVFNKKAMRNISLSIIKWVFSTIVWLAGTKLEVRGLENVPDDQPILYVGNHRSFFDIVISMIYVKRVTGYVAKKETKKVPFLAQWMVNLNCLFLDRSDIKQGLNIILKAIDLVKEGYSICIFPEGTRNKEEGTFLPFHEGSFQYLKTDEFKLILPEGHPLAKKRSVKLKEISEERFLMIRTGDREKYNDIMDAFEDAGVEMHTALHVDDDYTLVSMVEQGMGISIVSEKILKFADRKVSALSLDPPIIRDICIITDGQQKLPVACKRFISFVCEKLDQLS